MDALEEDSCKAILYVLHSWTRSSKGVVANVKFENKIMVQQNLTLKEAFWLEGRDLEMRKRYTTLTYLLPLQLTLEMASCSPYSNDDKDFVIDTRAAILTLTWYS